MKNENRQSFKAFIQSHQRLGPLLQRHQETLINILINPTHQNREGFPILSQESFETFLNEIPHLFTDGQLLLQFLLTLRPLVSEIDAPEKESILRAIDVLETVTRTANITAPTDLWLLRHVLSCHEELGFFDLWMSGAARTSEHLSKEHRLDPSQIAWDLHFLASRGVLVKSQGRFQLSSAPQARDLMNLKTLPQKLRESALPGIEACLQGRMNVRWDLESFLEIKIPRTDKKSWIPNAREVEIGFRLVPLILGIQRTKKEPKNFPDVVKTFLIDAGLLSTEHRWTELGKRVRERGPGPFGIIHAYHSYMQHRIALLKGNSENVWVARGENVDSSQDANKKTFQQINDSLDRYCHDTGFKYSVYIEHAVGRGEATRQRFERDQKQKRIYIGADLEDAAILKAKEAQASGLLPPQMKFYSQMDIGKPGRFLDALRKDGVEIRGAVMVVGNGFHEVRQQTNERMIQIFAEYCKAGIVLLFTEESGLSDQNLLDTGWNTYHAGFRYVHSLSGQGLRPCYDDSEEILLSWRTCAERGGYQILNAYCTHTRTIYPHPKEDGRNPSISMNYFCIPQ